MAPPITEGGNTQDSGVPIKPMLALSFIFFILGLLSIIASIFVGKYTRYPTSKKVPFVKSKTMRV